MATGLFYDSVTGQITSLLVATSLEAILRQVPPDGQAVLVADGTIDRTTLEQFQVVGGALLEKTPVLLSASLNPFPADGISECVISMTPFVPCTLLLNTTPYPLTLTDPTFVMTSEQAGRWTVTLAWHPTHWAAPLLLTAEEA